MTDPRYPPFDPTRYAQLIANPGPCDSGMSIDSRMTWALLVAQRKADAEELGWFGKSAGRSKAQVARYTRRRSAK